MERVEHIMEKEKQPVITQCCHEAVAWERMSL